MVKTKKQFQNVALFSSKLNQDILQITTQIIEVLENIGVKVFLTDSFSSKSYKNRKRYTNKYIVNNADIVVAIGGDGTLLSSARLFGSKGLPVLGVNLGKIGFLTDINPNSLTASLLEILNGRFSTDERFFLKSIINDSKQDHIALNEVVIHSGVVAQLIEYDLFINDEFVYRQKADGLIISTPTGSTAYSMSAGGPIIHPTLDVINIVPMSPHSLNTRSLVVDAKSDIKLHLLSKKINAKLSLDSHNILPLKYKDEISIFQAKPRLKLVHPKGHNFYAACRNKLNWSSEAQEN